MSDEDKNNDLEPKTARKAWHENPKNFQSLLKWGRQLIDENKNSRIICLGQSPAWIVKAAEIISTEENHPRVFNYIPFSGHTHTPAGKNAYQRNVRRSQPDTNQLAQYRQFLSTHQLSPDAIIERHKTGEQTLIVEYTETGRGLASFLSVLLDWAAETGQQEELAKSLKIANYSFGRINTAKEKHIQIDNHPPIAMRHYQVNNQLIFNLRMNDDPAESAQRFVPRYPHDEWMSPPAILSENSVMVDTITKSLESAVQSFIANSKSPAKN